MSNEVLERAIPYFAQGFNVLLTPIGHELKYKWRHWQRERQVFFDVIKISRRYPDYSNVALLTGFNNHLVLDCDSIAAYDKLISEYPLLENTFTVQTKDGYHVHLFCNNLPEKLPSKHSLDDKIEVWGYGHFAQMPGSVHSSGYVYSVHIDKPFLTIEDVSDIGIEQITPRKKESETFTPSSFPRRESDGNICSKIKTQILIPDILGNCDFEQSGAYHYLGYCCFHDDRERSLSWHTASNRVRCFSPNCKLNDKWYSPIDVYMMQHNVSFQEAVSKLSLQVRD